MIRRYVSVILVTLAALLACAAPAFAGGWAIITLDALPGEVHAGQALQVGFTVLQHGVTPTNRGLDDKPLVPILTLTPLAEGTDQSSGTPLTFMARQEGATGHYLVDFTFPQAGRWAWSISAPTYLVQTNSSNASGAEFAPLTVLPGVQSAQPPAESANIFSATSLRWAGMALLVAALAVLLAARFIRPGARSTAKAQRSA